MTESELSREGDDFGPGGHCSRGSAVTTSDFKAASDTDKKKRSRFIAASIS